LFALVAVSAQKSIIDTIAEHSSLRRLDEILKMPSFKPVSDILAGAGPFTVFAPNDEAFVAAGLDTSNTGLLTAILQNHVVAGRLLITDLKDGSNIRSSLLSNPDYVNTGSNSALNVEKFGDRVRVSFGGPRRNDTADVITADIACTNGVIHIVGRVIMVPGSFTQSARENTLTILVDAATKADLLGAFNSTKGITVLAPLNEAFNAINWESLTVTQLKALLNNHVVQQVVYSTQLTNNQKLLTLGGDTLTVRVVGEAISVVNAAGSITSNIRVPNVIMKNGVIHMMDKAL